MKERNVTGHSDVIVFKMYENLLSINQYR